jgi:integrase/recombinase XerD
MSKLTKNYGWLNTRPNSAKTLMERAKREIPGFKEHIRKFEEQINIKSYAPQLKQRVLLSLIYSAGLRVGEVCRLKVSDIDFHRKQIHVRESKNNKSRYVVLSAYIAEGLKQYIKGSKPQAYLFNGRLKGTPLGHSAVQQTFRLAMKKAGIIKEACVHTLRHSFATHLLEQGVDIVSIKDQLGHAHIDATMVYLHVARLHPSRVHSPFDKLYKP